MSHGGGRHKTRLVHKSSKKLDEVRSEINVTPLVDVVLVLLIVFMVVTDKLARGKEVTLPKSKTFVDVRETGDEMIVSVTKDGSRTRLYWDRDPLNDLADLKRRASEEMTRKKDKRVFVKADADLKYGDVYPVMIALHESGSEFVQVGVAQLKD